MGDFGNKRFPQSELEGGGLHDRQSSPKSRLDQNTETLCQHSSNPVAILLRSMRYARIGDTIEIPTAKGMALRVQPTIN
jgi:hypothetical protein